MSPVHCDPQLRAKYSVLRDALNALLETPTAEAAKAFEKALGATGYTTSYDNDISHSEIADRLAAPDSNTVPIHVELLVLGRPTLTGRIYAKEDVRRAMARTRSGSEMVQLGMPVPRGGESSRDFMDRIGRVDYAEVCGTLANIRIEGDVVCGEFTVAGPKAPAINGLSYPQDFRFGLRGLVETAADAGACHVTLKTILGWSVIPTPKE